MTVIIVNWNGEAYLEACLQALKRQTLPGLHVLLVDNGSTDGSLALVRTTFPEVQVVALEHNIGFGAANNAGIRVAQGQYVALLNNDTEADPRWLEESVRALEQNPEFGFCSAKMVMYEDRQIADACGDYYTIEGMAGKIGHGLPADRCAEPAEVFGACAGSAVYRKEVLEDLGAFDEDFFLIHEDTDLNARARLLGHRCLFVPSAVVYHRLSATIGARSELAVYFDSRNIEYVYIKNMPTSLILKYGLLRVFGVSLLFLVHLSRGRGRAFLRGKLAVVGSLGRLLHKRRAIQAIRSVEDPEFEKMLDRRWLGQGIARWVRRPGTSPRPRLR